MSETWTAERILALAPDASSAKSGRDLASARKWQQLGHDERSVWGLCQGSGANPYQTQIDLNEPAFKCSCPSRKFPCKHGLGLFLLLASSQSSFTQNERPPWVDEWLSKRTAKSEEKAKKREEAVAQPVDPAAAEKRLAAREKKVASGIKEIEIWLHDLIRQGLANVQTRPYSFWESVAARMVDAQCPGLARLIRQMGAVASSGQGWDSRLLRDLSRFHLVIEGYKRIGSLPAETQADLRTLIGFPIDQDRLLAQSGTRDTWLVLAQRIDREEMLRVQRTWLLGRSTQQPALILQFAHGAAAFPTQILPGTAIDADLVFFPSAYPMRALIKAQHSAPQPLGQAQGFSPGSSALPGHATIDAALSAYATALSRYPWLERFPLALTSVTPHQTNNTWHLSNPEGNSLPLAPRYPKPWHLLAASGAAPLWLFCEFDGESLTPMSMLGEDGFSLLLTSGEPRE